MDRGLSPLGARKITARGHPLYAAWPGTVSRRGRGADEDAGNQRHFRLHNVSTTRADSSGRQRTPANQEPAGSHVVCMPCSCPDGRASRRSAGRAGNLPVRVNTGEPARLSGSIPIRLSRVASREASPTAARERGAVGSGAAGRKPARGQHSGSSSAWSASGQASVIP